MSHKDTAESSSGAAHHHFGDAGHGCERPIDAQPLLGRYGIAYCLQSRKRERRRRRQEREVEVTFVEGRRSAGGGILPTLKACQLARHRHLVGHKHLADDALQLLRHAGDSAVLRAINSRGGGGRPPRRRRRRHTGSSRRSGARGAGKRQPGGRPGSETSAGTARRMGGRGRRSSQTHSCTRSHGAAKLSPTRIRSSFHKFIIYTV